MPGHEAGDGACAALAGNQSVEGWRQDVSARLGDTHWLSTHTPLGHGGREQLGGGGRQRGLCGSEGLRWEGMGLLWSGVAWVCVCGV